MRTYKIKYSVELWGKPADEESTPIALGIRVARKAGYADVVLVASILHDENGEASSILLMDSETGVNPSRQMLEMIKAQIEHQLGHHIAPTPARSTPPP